MLKGHVAESVVREHLQAAGHSVEMAATSNNPAWDLSADGHLLNVKAWKDGGDAAVRHLGAHPSIGVILSGDAEHIPHHALHFEPSHGIDFDAADHAGAAVFVDDALSHAEVAHDTANGLEVASGHVHVHIPWITMVLSGAREIKLLRSGHTDLLRATRNVAVDTGAIGLSGAAGAKAGAAFGTMIAPGVGTAVGAVIGGVGGAIWGRRAATKVRHAPLEDARSRYGSAMAAFESTRASLARSAEEAWTAFEQATAGDLREKAARAVSEARREVDVTASAVARAATVSRPAALQLLADAERGLEAELAETEEKRGRLAAWRRFCWPSYESVALDAKAARQRERIEGWRDRAAAARAHIADEAPAATVFDLALAHDSARRPATAFIVALGRIRIAAIERAEAVAQTAINTVAESSKARSAGTHSEAARDRRGDDPCDCAACRDRRGSQG
jgi:hypothetical protein